MKRQHPSLRSFDPVVVARLECDAWVAYYRHDWPALLRAGMILSRQTFGLSWSETIRSSWFAMQAARRWSPMPGNNPARARRLTERFYRIIQRRFGESFDPALAAALELDWWRAHREHQYSLPGSDELVLTDALARLYAYVYGVEGSAIRRAAVQRVAAMRHSDQWVREGCELGSPLIGAERSALEQSYVSLLAAVQRPVDVEPALECGASRFEGAVRTGWAPQTATS
jgi:hypothetical protein